MMSRSQFARSLAILAVFSGTSLIALGQGPEAKWVEDAREAQRALVPIERIPAFVQFIQVFQTVKPHPDNAIQRIVERASTGDANFALVRRRVKLR